MNKKSKAMMFYMRGLKKNKAFVIISVEFKTPKLMMKSQTRKKELTEQPD